MTGGEARPAIQDFAGWLSGIRRYVALVATANFIWEILQLPLYTIWKTGTWRSIVIAVLHCTAGDVIISITALVIGLVLFGDRRWPAENSAPVALVAVIGGLSYTIFSEWLNLVVRKSWAYSELMPIAPLLGTGISPLAQWIVIPVTGFLWARADACQRIPVAKRSTREPSR